MAEEQKTLEHSLGVVRAWLEDMATKLPSSIDELPTGFYDALLLQGLQVDHAENGRLVCTVKVPPRLLVRYPFFPNLSKWNFNLTSKLYERC